MLVHCIEHFGLQAADAVYVGDQRIDAVSARAAGVRFIGMGPAVHAASYRLERLADLASLLATM